MKDKTLIHAERIFALIVTMIALVIILAIAPSCRPNEPEITPTPTVETPTVTVTATATTPVESPTVVVPTITPEAPTATPQATVTPAPTSTPEPTATVVPSPTPYVPQGNIQEGWTSRYDPGVIEGVLQLHLTNGWVDQADIPSYQGLMATADCGEWGRVVWAKPLDAPMWRKFLVADCAGPDAWHWMIENYIIAEVDFVTWIEWEQYKSPRGLRIQIIRE